MIYLGKKEKVLRGCSLIFSHLCLRESHRQIYFYTSLKIETTSIHSIIVLLVLLY